MVRFAKIKTMTYEELKERLNNDGAIENNIIDDVRVIVTGHGGNIVSLSMYLKNLGLFAAYNSTKNIGFIIQFLMEFFDLTEDNSVEIDQLKGKPLRVVFGSSEDSVGWGDKAVAIGHFMRDEFVLIEDIVNLGLEDEE